MILDITQDEIVNIARFMKACEITGHGLGKEELDTFNKLIRFYIIMTEKYGFGKTTFNVNDEVIFVTPIGETSLGLNGRRGKIIGEVNIGEEANSPQKYYTVQWSNMENDWDDGFTHCTPDTIKLYNEEDPLLVNLGIMYKCYHLIEQTNFSSEEILSLHKAKEEGRLTIIPEIKDDPNQLTIKGVDDIAAT